MVAIPLLLAAESSPTTNRFSRSIYSNSSCEPGQAVSDNASTAGRRSGPVPRSATETPAPRPGTLRQHVVQQEVPQVAMGAGAEGRRPGDRVGLVQRQRGRAVRRRSNPRCAPRTPRRRRAAGRAQGPLRKGFHLHRAEPQVPPRSSAICPRMRQRDSGRAGSARVASIKWMVGGSCDTSRLISSWIVASWIDMVVVEDENRRRRQGG